MPKIAIVAELAKKIQTGDILTASEKKTAKESGLIDGKGKPTQKLADLLKSESVTDDDFSDTGKTATNETGTNVVAVDLTPAGVVAGDASANQAPSQAGEAANPTHINPTHVKGKPGRKSIAEGGPRQPSQDERISRKRDRIKVLKGRIEATQKELAELQKEVDAYDSVVTHRAQKLAAEAVTNLDVGMLSAEQREALLAKLSAPTQPESTETAESTPEQIAS